MSYTVSCAFLPGIVPLKHSKPFYSDKTMAKHRFTMAEHFAIWRVYGKKCFYCEQPLAFTEITIDHVVPEHVSDDAEQLQASKILYGLNTDFSINDYCNWVPAHPHCDRGKGATVYPATPALIMMLEKAQRKGKQARREADRIKRSTKGGDVLGKLGIALQGGLVSGDDVMVVLDSMSPEHDHGETIVITFSLNTDEALSQDLPATALPADYPSLCDWLEKDLVTQLSSLLTCRFFYPEASQRTGETLSVRLAFPQLDFNELDKFSSPWWTILEMQYYSEVYGSPE